MFLICIFFALSVKVAKTETTCLRFELMPYGRVTFNDASAACANGGGKLTYFLNAAEEEQFVAWSEQVGLATKTWLDLKRSGDTFVIPSLGNVAYTYNSWGTIDGVQQPDNADGVENCVELRSLFDWNDVSCDDELHFTCRFDDEKTGCDLNNLCQDESERTRTCVRLDYLGKGNYYHAQILCRQINAAPTYFLNQEEVDRYAAWKNEIGLSFFEWLDIYEDNIWYPTVIYSLGIKQPLFFFEYDQPYSYNGKNCVVFQSSSNWGYFDCYEDHIYVTCRTDVKISEDEYCRDYDTNCPGGSVDTGYSCVCDQGYVLNKDKTSCVPSSIQCSAGYVAVHGGTECKQCNRSRIVRILFSYDILRHLRKCSKKKFWFRKYRLCLSR
jgi:hypothetical protein